MTPPRHPGCDHHPGRRDLGAAPPAARLGRCLTGMGSEFPALTAGERIAPTCGSTGSRQSPDGFGLVRSGNVRRGYLLGRPGVYDPPATTPRNQTYADHLGKLWQSLYCRSQRVMAERGRIRPTSSQAVNPGHLAPAPAKTGDFRSGRRRSVVHCLRIARCRLQCRARLDRRTLCGRPPERRRSSPPESPLCDRPAKESKSACPNRRYSLHNWAGELHFMRRMGNSA